MKVMAEFQALAASFSGTIGLWAKSLQTGEVVEYGASRESFSSASVIKLPILYELFKQVGEGRVDLDAPWTLRKDEQVLGAGVLKELTPGIRLPIRDYATLMMIISDNLASNICIDVVDGPAAVTTSMEELGLTGIQLHNPFFKAVAGRPANQVVAADLGQLMDKIVRHEVLTPAHCDEIVGMMKRVQGPFASRFLSDDAVVATKTGQIIGHRHEVGAVWRGSSGFVYTVLTRGCTDERYHPDNEGQLMVGKAVAALYEHFLG